MRKRINNSNALIYNVEHGHYDTVEYLLKNGINIESISYEIMKYVIQNRYFKVASLLLKYGVKSDNLLIYYVNNENIKITKFLIENSVSINKDDALINSASRGYLDIVKLLIMNGADIHSKNESSLLLSAKNGHLDVVSFLLLNGANVHARDNLILKQSIIYRHFEVAKLLIENGASFRDDDDYIFCTSAMNGELDFVIFLVDKGANIHAQDEYALIWSLNKRHFEVTKYLIENGADIHNKNDYILNNTLSKRYYEIFFRVSRFYSSEILKGFLINKEIRDGIMKFLLKSDVSKYGSLVQVYREYGTDIFDLIEQEN